MFKTLRVHLKSSEPAPAIRMRIFTLHNALVKEVGVQNLGTEYLAEWDGQDDQGRIKQGIYIYQIEINGRAYNGSFVVAK